MYTPRFITTDDFKNYWGFDLTERLQNSSNAKSFLYRVEDRLMVWIDKYTFRNYKWDELTAFQLDNFKKALLNQAKYMLEQGDLALESGFDMEEGMKLRTNDLITLEVCRPAKDYLTTAGLLNFTIKNRRRGFWRNDL